MLTWLLNLATPLINSAWQRAVYNGKSTVGGGAIGAAVYGVLTVLESQGCDLSEVKPMALLPVLQGLFATDANKALVHHDDGKVSTVPVDPGRTSGDAAHDQAGHG